MKKIFWVAAVFLLSLLAIRIALPVDTCPYGSDCTAALIAQSTNCATAGSCAILPLAANSASLTVQLSGTFSGTMQFEGSNDGGNTYVAVNATPPSSTTAVTSATATGLWRIVVSGLTHPGYAARPIARALCKSR